MVWETNDDDECAKAGLLGHATCRELEKFFLRFHVGEKLRSSQRGPGRWIGRQCMDCFIFIRGSIKEFQRNGNSSVPVLESLV